MSLTEDGLKSLRLAQSSQTSRWQISLESRFFFFSSPPGPHPQSGRPYSSLRIRNIDSESLLGNPTFPAGDRGRLLCSFEPISYSGSLPSLPPLPLPLPRTPQWNDWRWQMAHRLSRAQDFEPFLRLSESERAAFASPSHFPVAVTPYIASLMEPDNPKCPLRMQFLPHIEEITQIEDMTYGVCDVVLAHCFFV